MAIVALRTDLLVFALLAQVLGFSPSTASFRPTPRGGPKVQMPRQTQPQGTLSTSKSTFSLVESQPVATSPTSIGNAIVTLPPACEVVKSLLSVCNSISPGFTTFSYENQTRCLCYPNTTSWQPEIFDGAVATCAQDVSTIPSEYSQVASLEGFCLRSMAGCNVSTTGSCATPTPSGIGTISVIPFPSPTQTQLSSSSPGIQSKSSFALSISTHSLSTSINKSRSYLRTKSWNWRRKFCGSISGGLWVRCFSANKTRELNGLNRPDTMKIVYLRPFASRSPLKSMAEAKSQGMSLLHRTTLRQLGRRKVLL